MCTDPELAPRSASLQNQDNSYPDYPVCNPEIPLFSYRFEIPAVFTATEIVSERPRSIQDDDITRLRAHQHPANEYVGRRVMPICLCMIGVIGIPAL